MAITKLEKSQVSLHDELKTKNKIIDMLQSDQKERDVNLDIAPEENFTVPKRYIKPKYSLPARVLQYK